MTLTRQRILGVTLVLVVAAVAGGRTPAQLAPSPAGEQSPQVPSSPAASPSPHNLPLRIHDPSFFSPGPEVSCACQPLFDFQDSDIKFHLHTLLNTLRDSTHEGWVLAAYPDPKTSRPLIGAGFGLDVMATEHLQRDPLNPHSFLEPSAAQLWQAAGLDPDRLQSILDQYDRDLKAWQKKKFRKKIRTHGLSPQLTVEDATKLLRISAIQAVHNAKAYCRNFDQLTAPQQMALSQLVFQMGVNLEEFVQFLTAINDDLRYRDAAQLGNYAETEAEHWKTVQNTLIQSDWARRYSSRAITVIAMFDPDYDKDPSEAERLVRATLRPPVVHHRKKPHAGSVRAASGTKAATQKAPRTP